MGCAVKLVVRCWSGGGGGGGGFVEGHGLAVERSDSMQPYWLSSLKKSRKLEIRAFANNGYEGRGYCLIGRR